MWKEADKSLRRLVVASGQTVRLGKTEGPDSARPSLCPHLSPPQGGALSSRLPLVTMVRSLSAMLEQSEVIFRVSPGVVDGTSPALLLFRSNESLNQR
jgi:hypothetical protein